LPQIGVLSIQFISIKWVFINLQAYRDKYDDDDDDDDDNNNNNNNNNTTLDSGTFVSA